MIPVEYVREEATEVLTDANKTEFQFLTEKIPEFVNYLLKQEREFFKFYGMYWFNLKELLQQYAPKQYRAYVEYVGGVDVLCRDDEVKKRYDYKSDMLNWTGAQMYLQERASQLQLQLETPHIDFVDDEERSYIVGSGYIDNEYRDFE